MSRKKQKSTSSKASRATTRSKGGKAQASKELKEVRSKVKTISKEKEELEDKLAYMAAEYENLKRRSIRDIDVRVLRRMEALYLDLLDVVDNLERGLESSETTDMDNYVKGVRMINLQLQQVLLDHGLEPIMTKDALFDPFKHEAVERVEDMNVQDGLIIEEVQRGYTLDGTVIRPSKVRVNVHPTPQKCEDESDLVEDQEKEQTDIQDTSSEKM